MKYVGVHSPSDLIALKVHQASNDFTLENSLEEWASIKISNRTYAQMIRGFFRANRHPLNVYIDSHTIDQRPPPSEDRLLYIFRKATLEQKALMALQIDTGERIRAVAMTSRSDLPDLQAKNQSLHVIRFRASRTKLHREHVSFFSEGTATLLRKHIDIKCLKDNDPLFPNFQHVWKAISQYSKTIGTYLKSHHLRKRFVHLAERTPIPIPDIDYLMGDKKQGVHCAEAYSYTINDELAIEYRNYLLPRLTLGSTSKPDSILANSLSDIVSEVAKTSRQIEDLAGLIKVKMCPECMKSGTKIAL